MHTRFLFSQLKTHALSKYPLLSIIEEAISKKTKISLWNRLKYILDGYGLESDSFISDLAAKKKLMKTIFSLFVDVKAIFFSIRLVKTVFASNQKMTFRRLYVHGDWLLTSNPCLLLNECKIECWNLVGRDFSMRHESIRFYPFFLLLSSLTTSKHMLEEFRSTSLQEKNTQKTRGGRKSRDNSLQILSLSLINILLFFPVSLHLSVSFSLALCNAYLSAR